MHPQSVVAALVPPPVRRVSSAAEGVAALDPQLDSRVELVHRRTVPPIGAPSSPVTSSATASSPSSSSAGFPFASKPAPQSAPAWSWSQSQTFSSVVSRSASAAETAEAAAQDVLNGALDALDLGPPAFDASPSSHTSHAQSQPFNAFQGYTQVSNPQKALDFSEAGTVQSNGVIGANSISSPQQQFQQSGALRDATHPTRSVLLRNLPPGVDDDSLRKLLEAHGPLRDLGAQHRARGGRGSVVATYFDLRHARAAVQALDNSTHFGRRLEARYQCPTMAPATQTSPQGPDGLISPRARRHANGAVRAVVSPRGKRQQSPPLSPSSQHLSQPSVNQGTLVVFNLDPSTTAEEIRKLFGSVGDVKEIRATPNKRHHKFVEFFDVRDAERALLTLNKTEVGGKKIKIEISRPGGRGMNAARNAVCSTGSENKTIPIPASSQPSASSLTPPSLTLPGSSGTHAGLSTYSNNVNGPAQGQRAPHSASFQSTFTPNGHNVSGNGVCANGAPGNSTSAINLMPAPSSPNGYYTGSPHPNGHSQFLPFDDSGEGIQFSHSARNGPGDGYPQQALSFDSARHRYATSEQEKIQQEMEMRQRQVGSPALSYFSNQRKAASTDWSAGFSLPSMSPGRMIGSRLPDLATAGNANGAERSVENRISPLPGRIPGLDSSFDFGSENKAFIGDHGSPAVSPLSSTRGHSNGGFHGPLHDEYYLEQTALTPNRPTADKYGRDVYSAGRMGGQSPFYTGNTNGSPFPQMGGAQLSPLSSDRSFGNIGDPTTNGREIPKRLNAVIGGSHTNGIALHIGGADGGSRRSSPGISRQHGGLAPNATSSGPGQTNPKFLLNIEKVRSGVDTRTALMIRNIPNKYNQRMLLAALEENHKGHFDFIYLPIDFKNKCNVGYAFINFTDTKHVPDFYNEFHGRKWGRFNSEKVCEITYARIQGRNNLIGHFQNSSLMNEDPKCRPVVFDPEGRQEEFPVGSNVRTRRGPSARDANRLHDHSPPYSPLKQRGHCN